MKLRNRKENDNRATWFIDQSLVSNLIAGWVERHGGDPTGLVMVEFGLKKVNRLDRGKMWGEVVGNCGWVVESSFFEISKIRRKCFFKKIDESSFFEKKLGESFFSKKTKIYQPTLFFVF